MWGRGVLPASLPAPFSATLSLALSVYQTACPVRPTLRQSRSRHGHENPLLPGCLSPPLLLVWMCVSFLSTWCQTSLPFNILSVLVVRGGAVCLPTPPSWFSKCMCLFFKFQSNTFTHLLGIYTWCHTEYSWNNALESACSRMCSSNPPHLNECHHPLYIGAPNLGTIFDLIPTASPDISTFKTAIGPVHFPTTTII